MPKLADLTRIQRLWTKIKNNFVAKDAKGDVHVTNDLRIDGITSFENGANSYGNVEINDGKLLKMYSEDASKSASILCNNDGKLVGNGGVMATTTDVNTAVSGLASQQYVASTVGTAIANLASKTDVSTAVAGLATETFVNSAVANAGHLKREKVTTLPGVATASENVIYMVPATDGSGNDVFDEYMKIDGKLEKIGSNRVDLSGYPTTEQMNIAISNSYTLITDAEIDALE